MTVREAVERELASWESRLPGVSESALAATAVALASRIDDEAKSATAVSNCANSLASVLDTMRGMLPPEQEHDAVDDLARRRASRRATA